MRRYLRPIAAMVPLITAPLAGHAEPCWMIGCVGRVGYIFLPEQTYPPGYRLNERRCTTPPANPPFQGAQLPDVNSAVAIATDGTLLLTADAIESHLGSFPPPQVTADASTGGCHASIARPVDVPGNAMKAGAKVRILGYRTFVGQGSEIGAKGAVTRREQLLFALVVVLAETP